VSKKSSFYRVFEILKLLNESKRLCIDTLSKRYGVSQRTIRRDFDLIVEIFGEFLTKEKLCYKAYKKLFLDDILTSHELTVLTNIIDIFAEANNEKFIKPETKELLKNSSKIYDFKSRPFESLKNQEILKALEYSIKFHKVIGIGYRANISFFIEEFEPYRIVFVNENFYLVGVNRDKKRFEFLRVSMIKEVKESKKSFFLDHKIVEFIKKIQTPWSNFYKKETVIALKTHKSISRYFLKKRYLPSQKILERLESGELIVEYTITNIREIEELIIKWLPRVEIVSPLGIKKYIRKILYKKLEPLNDSDQK
jgi:predicted DNA-binding transcriptional regulator YafY